jgi:hypothetical protein
VGGKGAGKSAGMSMAIAPERISKGVLYRRAVTPCPDAVMTGHLDV